MTTSVTMTYGAYEFSPVPSFSYSRDVQRLQGQDVCLSTPIRVTLDGIIFPTGTGGFGPVTDEVKNLSNTFKCGSCQTFQVACDGNNVFNAPAKVINLNINPRNDGDLYVNTAAYTIELEMVSMTGDVYDNQPNGISSISETWDFSIKDERVGGLLNTAGIFNNTGIAISIATAWDVSHNVTVTAPFQCKDGSSDIIGWEQAAAYIINQYTTANPDRGIANLFLIPSNTRFYNHFRNVSKNVTDGTITMNESWVGSNGIALEDFDVTIDTSLDNYLKTVTVNGSIQGLVPDMTYSQLPEGSVNGSMKLENALVYWANIRADLFSRASTVYDGNYNARNSFGDANFFLRSLNPVPITESVGYNSTAGTVTYSFSYDDRPSNFYALARAENISVVENNPNDIFASLTVLGRPGGPLFQDGATIGPRTREISIEAVLPVDTLTSVRASGALVAPSVYDAYVADYENYLTATFDQVFTNSAAKNWNPKDGRFTFNKSWTVGSCS